MAFCFAAPKTAFSVEKTGKAQKRIVDEGHLAFIRKLPSVISGHYGCEACHIRAGNPMYRKPATAMSRKPDDAWTLPLTPDEHRQQHNMNELEFWKLQGIDPHDLAFKLYELTGNFEAGREIIRSIKR